MKQMINRDSFIESLHLPETVFVKHYEGMTRHSFRFNGDVFVSLDMQTEYYHLRTKEAYLRAIQVYDYEMDKNHPVVPATIKKISYENAEVLNKLISYITNGAADTINKPMKPKNRIRKNDGTIIYLCGRCNNMFIKAPRCPECGQLVKG